MTLGIHDDTRTEKEHLECTSFTLLGSSVIALTILVAAVLGGIPFSKVERIATQLSIPWFVFWNLFCRFTSRIKIRFVNND